VVYAFNLFYIRFCNLFMKIQYIDPVLQADPLLPLLTATELLTLFATLRGVPERDIEEVVSGTMRMLGFQEYAHRVCGSFSGGNKRKLSVGTALVGQPPVVLLDEPSAGLDPGARHFLWNFISGEVIGDGRTVLLTSQSMEECEVLCNRIAIMSAGALQCIGTPQHLKARFAKGYTLELRFGAAAASGLDDAGGRRFLAELEATGTVMERDARHVVFHLPTCDLPTVFEGIEAHSSALGITDYALNQTTLEHVFLHVTEGQGQA
jgi:ABC-type multidrug transport system ATPase subunit